MVKIIIQKYQNTNDKQGLKQKNTNHNNLISMKKITQTIIVLIALFATTCLSAQAQDQWTLHQNNEKATMAKAPQADDQDGNIFIGHSSIDDQIWPMDGLSLSFDSRVGVGVILTRDMFEPYIGGKMAYMIVGWDDMESKATYDCFVRSNEFFNEDITTGSGSAEFGWNIIPLNYAEIPDVDRLCIGFYTELKKNVCSIPFLYPKNTPNTIFLHSGEKDKDGKEIWYDMHTVENMGKMPIILVLEDPEGMFVNMVSIDGIRFNPVVWGGDVHEAIVRLTNKGSNTIHQIEVETTFGDDKFSDVIDLENPILTGSSQKITVPLYCLGTGVHQLSINKINRAKARGNNTAEADMIGVPYELEGKYTSRPVIEYFTSEESYMQVQHFDKLFYPGFAPNKDDYTLIMPHLDDKFMTGDNDALTELLKLVDNDSLEVYVPSLTINRSDNLEYCAGLEGTIFHNGTPFPEALSIIPMYDNILKKPTFASVNIAANFSDNLEQVDITVSGNVAENVMPEGEPLYLTVYLMERDVVSQDQLFWDDKESGAQQGEYTHKCIIRDILTEYYGDQLEKTGGDYTQSFTVELDPEWKKSNLYVAAFLNRSIDNTTFKRNIINSNEGSINWPEAVSSVNNDNNAKVTTLDGAIYVNGSTDNVQVYNIAGARLNNNNLPGGVYIIRHNAMTAKVLVK